MFWAAAGEAAEEAAEDAALIHHRGLPVIFMQRDAESAASLFTGRQKEFRFGRRLSDVRCIPLAHALGAL